MKLDDLQSYAILDPERIADLHGLDEDDPGVFAEIVELYLASAPLQIDALARAVEAGNRAEVSRQAHTLKGSSSAVGVRRVVELAILLERMGTAGNVEGAGPLLGELRTCFEWIPGALRHEVRADRDTVNENHTDCTDRSVQSVQSV